MGALQRLTRRATPPPPRVQAWYHNVVANPDATVEVRDDTIAVTARAKARIAHYRETRLSRAR